MHQENKEKKIQFQNKNVQNIEDERKKLFTEFYENVYMPENITVISQNFFGVRELATKCGNCQLYNYEYKICSFIEFPLEEIYKNLSDMALNMMKNERNKSFLNLMNCAHEKTIHLNVCFEYYLYMDKPKNILVCNKCKTQSNNSKYNHKLMILPNILCIVLKNNKDLKVRVDFSESLDLSKYLDKFVVNKNYKLIGIITYNYESKVYCSISKNIDNKKWYFYDGDRVVIFDNYKNQNIGIPYMILYQNENPNQN